MVTVYACSHQVAVSTPDWRQDWRARFDAGKEANTRGDKATAEREFQVALDIARIEKPPGLATALCLNALAKLWIDTGRLEEARPALTESMRNLSSREYDRTPALCNPLTNRGDLEMKEKRYADAEADFQRALQITEQRIPIPTTFARVTRTMLVGLVLQGRVEEGDTLGKQFGMKCGRDSAGAP